MINTPKRGAAPTQKPAMAGAKTPMKAMPAKAKGPMKAAPMAAGKARAFKKGGMAKRGR